MAPLARTTASFSSGEVGFGRAAGVAPGILRQAGISVPLRARLGIPLEKEDSEPRWIRYGLAVLYDFSIRVHSLARRRSVTIAVSSQPLTWSALAQIRASFVVGTQPDRHACALGKGTDILAEVPLAASFHESQSTTVVAGR